METFERDQDIPISKTNRYTGKTLNIRQYSERAIVVYGEDTKEMKEDFKEIGGSYNPNLKHPLYPSEKLKGWVFPLSKKSKIIDFCIMQDIDYKADK